VGHPVIAPSVEQALDNQPKAPRPKAHDESLANKATRAALFHTRSECIGRSAFSKTNDTDLRGEKMQTTEIRPEWIMMPPNGVVSPYSGSKEGPGLSDQAAGTKQL
jgi:hypothetical protein